MKSLFCENILINVLALHKYFIVIFYIYSKNISIFVSMFYKIKPIVSKQAFSGHL